MQLETANPENIKPGDKLYVDIDMGTGFWVIVKSITKKGDQYDLEVEPVPANHSLKDLEYLLPTGDSETLPS